MSNPQPAFNPFQGLRAGALQIDDERNVVTPLLFNDEVVGEIHGIQHVETTFLGSHVEWRDTNLAHAVKEGFETAWDHMPMVHTPLFSMGVSETMLMSALLKMAYEAKTSLLEPGTEQYNIFTDHGLMLTLYGSHQAKTPIDALLELKNAGWPYLNIEEDKRFTTKKIIDTILDHGLTPTDDENLNAEVVHFTQAFGDFYLDHAQTFEATPGEFQWQGVNGVHHSIVDFSIMVGVARALENAEWPNNEENPVREGSRLIALSFATNQSRS